MSSTHILFAYSDYNFLLRVEQKTAGRMKRVAYLREHAILMLKKAIQRIPVASESIVAAYRAKGIEPIWDLENDRSAIELCAKLKDYTPTANELHAAELLRACIAAKELGDVPEFKHMRFGEKQLLANKNNGKKRGKLSPAQRNRIRNNYQTRCDAGEKHGAIKSLATQYNVSRTTISTIVNKKN